MEGEKFELKPLSKDGIPAAIAKAMRYRLLNEPGEAESICQDILHIDGENQEALMTLLLAQTNRLGKSYAIGDHRVETLLHRLQDPYQRTYFAGLVKERRAKAHLHCGHPGASYEAYENLREAMTCYEEAETIALPATRTRCSVGLKAC